ncbi:MAG TPA: sigma-70 family RNA polymerase sigma factor [Bryobacteraceae bacterium]|nr:sigma-70 family RNA polymerase sigma factor [Bryobacteraceae bacterium]
MKQDAASETTALLRAWAEGDESALARLTPLVYQELRRIAGRCMQNERPGHSIQTTELVHEAYLRLIDVDNVSWEHRAHFYAVSATIMRRILLDAARKRSSAKRGARAPLANLEQAPDLSCRHPEQVIALDDALERLGAIDARKGRVVELRFFVGLSLEETAEVLKVSVDSVVRDWRLARAWLLSELRK